MTTVFPCEVTITTEPDNLNGRVISRIQEISAGAFGSGYILGSESDSNCFVFLTARLHEEIVGFATYGILSYREALSQFPELFRIIRPLENQKKTIGIIGSIAIASEYRNRGIGGALLRKISVETQIQADIVLSLCWLDKQGQSTFKEMLIRKGFRVVARLQEPWCNDSLKRNYQCAVCGDPPCLCPADLLMFYLV